MAKRTTVPCTDLPPDYYVRTLSLACLSSLPNAFIILRSLGASVAKSTTFALCLHVIMMCGSFVCFWQLMQKLKEAQEINLKLHEYVDRMTLKIIEKNPSLLEKD